MKCQHRHDSVLQKAVRQAAIIAGIQRNIGPHTFRYSFALHLLEAGYDIRTVQALLGYKDAKTTMICTHVLNRGPNAVRRPLDERGCFYKVVPIIVWGFNLCMHFVELDLPLEYVPG